VLKRLGRTVIAHYRGCEARDREKNMMLHPVMNICQHCDYDPPVCMLPLNRIRRAAAAAHADLSLVTTPDLLDFIPHALHFPFFSPSKESLRSSMATRWPKRGRFKIVHVTNHPGIEGTADIVAAIERLKARGYPIDFVFLQAVTHERVLAEYADADLTIGKMKMGYYANAQIESLACGVPAVTHIRPEFMTPAIRDSGLIPATLDDLDVVIADYVDHPEKLAEKSRSARESVGRLHDNAVLGRQLVRLYETLRSGGSLSRACNPAGSLDANQVG
jgi:hypothetical protein